MQNMSVTPAPADSLEAPDVSPISHCDSNSLTDSYGLAVQLILAGFAFGSLVVKRFYCEPREVRRTWTIWFFDTSKQAVGAGVIHFLNVFLAQILHQKRGDPCTWYVVSFLLDSTLGLLIIYSGVRVVTRVASWKDWSTLRFGEYGKPPRCQAWFHQCAVFVGIIIVEKMIITGMLEFQFWRHVREIILSPITNPKLEVTIVMLIIPFFVNTLIFWVVDSFTMRKLVRSSSNGVDDAAETGSLSKNGKVRNQRAIRTYMNERRSSSDGSECGERLLAHEEDVFGSETLETNQQQTKENVGLLSGRDSAIHQRLNSVTLI